MKGWYGLNVHEAWSLVSNGGADIASAPANCAAHMTVVALLQVCAPAQGS